MAQRDRGGLQLALADIQQRWGSNTLHTLGKSHTARIPHLPTGFAVLDRALGIGGLPRGHITEISGAPTSGMATLALKIIGQAHAAGELAAYLDVAQTFDADYAIRCGIDAPSLLVVRPQTNEEALDIAGTLASSGSTSVIVCDFALRKAGGGHEITVLRRLAAPIAQSGCVFIGLFPFDPAGPAIEQAALRLQVVRQRWLFRRQDVQGYRAQITILKNKFAPVHRPVELTIGFSSTVAGDGT